jgi:drug/metabolite transporter (DMT)-like permease
MPDDPRRERRIAYLCAFAVLFIWTGFMIFGRLSARQAFTPYDVALLRYAGGFATALPIALVRGLPRVSFARGVALTASAAYAFPILAYIGFTLAPAAHGGVMLPGMLPFVAAALFALVFRDAFSRTRLVSLGIVAVGIALLAFDTLPAHPGAWRGDLLFLGGSTAWAIYMALVRHWGIGALDATLIVALLGLPLYLPVWWLALPSNLGAVPWGPIIVQTVFQGAIALVLAGFLFTRAMATLGAARLTTITALVPGMAALAAWPLLDEPLGMAGIAGVLLVGGAIVLAVRQPRT